MLDQPWEDVFDLANGLMDYRNQEKKETTPDGKEIILLRVQPEGQPEAWAADCLMNTKLESMHLNRED